MKTQTLKYKLLSLRKRLSKKTFGTEIKSLENGNFITISTTKATGAISKKQITAKVEINSAFLNLSILEQERKLLNVLFEEQKKK